MTKIRNSSLIITLLAVGALATGCSPSGDTSGSAGQAGRGTAGSGGSAAGAGGSTAGAGGTTPGSAGSQGGSAGAPDGGQPDGGGTAGTGAAGTDGGGPAVGTCSPPDDIYMPVERLTLTGCMDSKDPTKPVSRALAYEVNSPLWSDGADKTRAFVLPAGGKIHVDATTGKWVFPTGTVLIKSFLFDGKVVETRLFMHYTDEKWVGYSYKWNGQGTGKQTEATIVGPDLTTRDDVAFDTGKRTVHWYYPSREDCMKCHNDVARGSLGPESAQMYRTVTGHAKNQIDEFKDLGLFDVAPATPTASQVLPLPYATGGATPPAGASLDQKARSYLQANCAHCHRPNENGIISPFPNFDLRFQTAAKDLNICNVAVNKGAVGGFSKILVPGKPAESVMYLRMNAAYTDTGAMVRMPQIGTHVIDTDGVKLIGDWITALPGCPQ
jgi:uncharacterized repeat protein (TIGR03806 family)